MLRTLEVFEHGRIYLAESGAGLRRHELDALVQFNDHHGGRYFEVGHKYIRARNYVGYVEVGEVAIEILPKADRDAAADAQGWREGLLEMLRIGGGLALHRMPSASQKVTRSRLLELIAQAYLVELESLLREGLAKGYRSVEANSAVFRGKLKVADHIRENVARADRFFVEYQTFDHHITINRVLASALEALSWCALSPGTACAVEACLARFPELQTAGVTGAVVDRIRPTRATKRYEKALIYARMILSQQGPQLRAGRERVFAFLFDMNTLWERYIAALVRRAAPAGMQVHTQEQHAFWLPQRHSVRRVRPDIVVRDAGGATLLVIDTKWKVPANGLPSDEDLKQMFVYNELLAGAHSILLYPRTAKSFPATGGFANRQRPHSCAQHHLGVFASARWSTAAILQQLRQLLEQACHGRADWCWGDRRGWLGNDHKEQ